MENSLLFWKEKVLNTFVFRTLVEISGIEPLTS